MEKAVGIGLFALLVVGVAFVQVHYYRERQRAKAECERLEQSIGQMQKQYVDVVKQNQSYRQMNHELKKYQWLVQVMRENMGTVTHGQLLELVLQKKIQEAEHKQITCDVQGTLNGNLRMDEMSLAGQPRDESAGQCDRSMCADGDQTDSGCDRRRSCGADAGIEITELKEQQSEAACE